MSKPITAEQARKRLERGETLWFDKTSGVYRVGPARVHRNFALAQIRKANRS